MVTSTITVDLICCLLLFSIKLGEMVSVCVLALLTFLSHFKNTMITVIILVTIIHNVKFHL